ncbi:hypothetical protein Bbad01_35640 [Bacillus badius]|nr:hypothetical protein Bbad01_35640 [Bacillus badius]
MLPGAFAAHSEFKPCLDGDISIKKQITREKAFNFIREYKKFLVPFPHSKK